MAGREQQLLARFAIPERRIVLLWRNHRRSSKRGIVGSGRAAMRLRALCYAVVLGSTLAFSANSACAAASTATPEIRGNTSSSAQEAPSTEAVSFRGSIFPHGDTDTYHVTLPGGSGRVFTFALFNGTRGFDPVMVIRGGGKTFVVDHNGPSGGEIFRLGVRGTVGVTVIIGAFHGQTVGNYLLRVTP